MQGNENSPPEDFAGCYGGASEDLDRVDQIDCLSGKIDRYGRAHKRALQMSSYVWGEVLPDVVDGTERDRINRLGMELSGCGHLLWFRNYHTIEEVRLTKMRSCKKFQLCPLCAIRKAGKSLSRYLVRWDQISRERPALRPYLAVFTVKNGEDLPERMDHLMGCFRKLLERRRQGRRTELAKLAGAVYSVEITNRGNGWHPHIQMLALLDPNDPLDFSELRREWNELTGDSHQVYVEPIRPDEDGSYVKGFCEVFKYNLKFSDLSLAQNWYAYQVLRGRKMFGSFGAFRGIPEPDKLTDDVLDADLPYMDLIYRYYDSCGYSLEEIQTSENEVTTACNGNLEYKKGE